MKDEDEYLKVKMSDTYKVLIGRGERRRRCLQTG